MTEDERRRAFAEAFIVQARSDWRVYRILAERNEVPSCHRLHYLQMVCEKLAKAYRLRDTKSPIDDLVSKHSGFSKFVGPFFTALKDEYRGKDEQLRGLIQRARTLAREIEKLAPAIDRSASPENAVQLLTQPGGRAFLNLVERALDDFERVALP